MTVSEYIKQLEECRWRLVMERDALAARIGELSNAIELARKIDQAPSVPEHNGSGRRFGRGEVEGRITAAGTAGVDEDEMAAAMNVPKRSFERAVARLMANHKVRQSGGRLYSVKVMVTPEQKEAAE